jgi:SAM-dependent methyltransferase
MSEETPKTKYTWGANGERRNGPTEPYILDRQGISPYVEKVYGELQRLPKGGIVLDVGSGAGRLEENAPKNRPYSFLGIELDAGAVKKFDAKKKELGLPDHIVVASATELGFESKDGHNALKADAAVSWRVLHNFEEPDQLTVCKDIYGALPSGGSFYVSVLSDQDWKLRALRKSGTPVDLSKLIDSERVMDLVENNGKATDDPTRKQWPLYYFTQDRLRELAKQSGFEVAGNIEVFKEPSGMPHLLAFKDERSEVTYYYVHFRKPD